MHGIKQIFITTIISSLPDLQNAFLTSIHHHPHRMHHQHLLAKSTDTITLPPPPSPSSFAGMVETGLTNRFDANSISRIIESWRNVDKGVELRQFVGSDDCTDPETSHCHQHATSFVRDLTTKPWWDATSFEWCTKLADKYDVIRDEFDRVTADATRLREEGNNIWAKALTDDASSYGEGWSTLVLLDKGAWDDANVRLFPETSRIIRDAGVPAVEIFFASMLPRSDIKMHSDFTNFVLTSHLALDIPDSGEGKCRISVGDEMREWINGEVTLFDTSIMHDAVNESDKTRYILMFRVWHPDLTAVEREALQFIFDSLQLPELVSSDPGKRFIAEERLKILREFPKLKVKGFAAGKNMKKGKRKGTRRMRK